MKMKMQNKYIHEICNKKSLEKEPKDNFEEHIRQEMITLK